MRAEKKSTYNSVQESLRWGKSPFVGKGLCVFVFEAGGGAAKYKHMTVWKSLFVGKGVCVCSSVYVRRGVGG